MKVNLMSNFNNITDTERLILANQYDILHILKPDDGYNDLSEQLRNGHVWLYSKKLSNCLSGKNMSNDDAQYVLDVLDLFECLHDHGAKDKFIGFDGNYESDYLGFANALFKNKQYVHLMPKGCPNSHCQTTAKYKSKLAFWESINKSRQLTAEHLQHILKL